MPEDSPYDALTEAYREAKSVMEETTKAVKADIVRPADPNANLLSRSERIADYENFEQDPFRRESEFMRLRERYKLPDHKPIPRRLVNYVIERRRERDRREKYG